MYSTLAESVAGIAFDTQQVKARKKMSLYTGRFAADEYITSACVLLSTMAAREDAITSVRRILMPSHLPSLQRYLFHWAC